MLTLACLIELWGSRRAWLIGLMAGAAFLSRAPVAFAVPFYALLLAGDAVWEPRRWPWRAWVALAAGVLPSIVFFFWYNDARFGSPFESGYALATLPAVARGAAPEGPVLDRPHPDESRLPLRPSADTGSPSFRGSSRTAWGCRSSSRARDSSMRSARRGGRAAPWWLLGAAVAVLVPTLLYYGGGWLQYGYRYALDSIPFVFALCGLAAARDERLREAGTWRAWDRAGLAAAHRRRADRRARWGLLGLPPLAAASLGDVRQQNHGAPRRWY